MKKILLPIILLVGTLPLSATWGNGYTYRRTITIPHTSVPNTDQANFPVPVKGTFAYLATVANSGKAQNGNDIIFTSDAAGTTKLNFDIELYTATTGVVAYIVNVPLVTTATDTLFYIFYGNAAVVTDQSSKAATWNANYIMVQHFGTPTVLSTTDATSNGNNLTNTNGGAEVGLYANGGLVCNGSSATLNAANNASLNVTNLTIEMWLNWGALSGTFEEVVRKGSPWFFFSNGANQAGLAINNDFGSAAVWGPAANTTYYVVATYTNSTKAVKLYINGTLFNSRTTASNLVNDTTNLFVCANESGIQFSGNHMDELRLSNTDISADRVSTLWNAENAPLTFSAQGTETLSNTSIGTTTLIL